MIGQLGTVVKNRDGEIQLQRQRRDGLREMAGTRDAEARTRILERIDEIALAVKELKTPTSFADQLYVLRDHVATVRRRVQTDAAV